MAMTIAVTCLGLANGPKVLTASDMNRRPSYAARACRVETRTMYTRQEELVLVEM